MLVVGLSLVLGACKSTPSHGPGRTPAQAFEEHNHSAPDDFANSAEFKATELDARHTFVISDSKGHFGYHFTAFNSPHQHQVIAKMKVTRRKMSEQAVQTLLGQAPTNSYYSITTNPPRVKVRDIFTGKLKDFRATLYDGLILEDSRIRLDTDAGLAIEKILYTHPMIPAEQKLVNATHILFGSYSKKATTDKNGKAVPAVDKPSDKYAMAHLIQGADNYEQLLRVTITSGPINFYDYQLLSINIPDNTPLTVGQSYDATLKDGTKVTVRVDRQLILEDRTAN